MTFTTPCFVRVENPEKRKELIKWLKGIGYTHFPFIHDSCLIATDSDGRIWLTDANRGGAYDCQTDTDLFKALAAMNDENDREQWFTDGYHFELCPTNKADMVAWHMVYRTKPRKATAEEIVEYFKNKER
jgi:hypothetical protein